MIGSAVCWGIIRGYQLVKVSGGAIPEAVYGGAVLLLSGLMWSAAAALVGISLVAAVILESKAFGQIWGQLLLLLCFVVSAVICSGYDPPSRLLQLGYLCIFWVLFILGLLGSSLCLSAGLC